MLFRPRARVTLCVIRRRVLAKCSSALGRGQAEDAPFVALDRAFELSYQAAYEEMAGRGERVLACAMLPLDGAEFPADFDFDDENFPQEGACVLA